MPYSEKTDMMQNTCKQIFPNTFLSAFLKTINFLDIPKNKTAQSKNLITVLESSVLHILNGSCRPVSGSKKLTGNCSLIR